MHRTAFSYYGGKGIISHRFPPPKHRKIIEPFAGGAAYSLRYYKHDVVLNDLNPKVYDAWNFITNFTNYKFIKKIPVEVKAGDKIDEIIKEKNFPDGLQNIMRAAANVGTFGAKKCNQITKIGAENWKHNTINKLRFWMPKLSHWEVTKNDYVLIKNIEATWFIDPPYNNEAGKRYAESNIDYNKLAKWCKSRKGQVIVCENSGASWLPFRHLCKHTGVNSKNKSKRPSEVIYTNNLFSS